MRNTLNALIVDDDPIARRSIVFALRQEGFECDQAGDGDAAGDWLANKTYDLVVTDLRMPRKHGYALSLELLQLPTPPLLIVHTVVDEPRLIKDLILRGVDDIIGKPANYRVFAAKMWVRIHQRKRSKSLRDMTPVTSDAAASEAGHPTTADSDTTSTDSTAAKAPRQSIVIESDMSQAAEKLTDIKPVVRRAEIEQALDECGELKGMSPTVMQVLKLSRQKDCSLEDLAKTIKQDQAISLKILKLANSAVYTRGESVDTVQKAVMRIGMSQIHQTVMNIGVMEKFDEVKGNDLINSAMFWEHSIATGLIAAEITRKLEGSEEAIDAAFTMGLLHDVGRMVYVDMLGDTYHQVCDVAARLRLPVEQVESRMLLINHADAMDRVLHAWRFPNALINPIVFHHLSVGNIRRVAPRALKEVATLALANRLAHALLLGSSGNMTLYPIEEFVATLNLEGSFIRKIEGDIPGQTTDIKYAMLSRMNGQIWPTVTTTLHEQLHAPLRPIVASHDPDIDAIRIFCDRLSSSASDDNKPNVGVVHLGHPRHRTPVAGKLLDAEKKAGVEPLPLVILSPSGDLKLEDRAMAGRQVQLLAYPATATRLVEAVNTVCADEHAEVAA